MTQPSPPPAGEQHQGDTREAENGHHHLLVQAPVEPMDVDGFNAAVTGTVAFAVATVLTAVFYVDLSARGDGWWLGVSIAGTALGLVGLFYCWNRRRQRRSGPWATN